MMKTDGYPKAGVIKRQRLLPIEGQILVQIGDTVAPDTVVARAELPGAPIPINVAYQLKTDAHLISRYLQVKVGDPVEKGDLLATTGGPLRILREEVLAPVSGTVEEINERTGSVVIRLPNILVDRHAYLPGQVAEIIPGSGVVVEAHARLISAVFGVGGERFGPLAVASAAPDLPLTEDMIAGEMRGAVILGGSSITAGALRKAARMGVAAIISGGIDSEALAAYLGYEIGVPITGQEAITTALILTEGFGNRPMNSALHEELKSYAGRTVSLNGTTHLRSNLVLPEIIIPLAKTAN